MIDLDRVDVTERKASLLVDTAKAFLQCGKYEGAYLALRSGQDIAPHEIADRPAVHRLLRDRRAAEHPPPGSADQT